MRRLFVYVIIFFIMSICLAGCPHPLPPAATDQAARDALNAIKDDLNGSDADQLARDAEHLDGLPSGDFASGDLNLRTSLIQQAAVKSLDLWAGFWVISEKEIIKNDAQQDAAKDTVDASDRFKDALSDVTEDAIRGKTCESILNLVAPEPRANATGSPDDAEWKGDIEQDAASVLVKTFRFTGIDSVMQWASWYTDVTSAASQAAASIATESVSDIQFLSNPAGQRATAIYVRYCYAPPTTD